MQESPKSFRRRASFYALQTQKVILNFFVKCSAFAIFIISTTEQNMETQVYIVYKTRKFIAGCIRTFTVYGQEALPMSQAIPALDSILQRRDVTSAWTENASV